MISALLEVIHSFQVALKAMQLYSASHPRAAANTSQAYEILSKILEERPNFHLVCSQGKLFADKVPLDDGNLHVKALAAQLEERKVSGFEFDRGLGLEELRDFLAILTLKLNRIEAEGGFEALFQAKGIRNIKISKVRFKEVNEDGGTAQESRQALHAAANLLTQLGMVKEKSDEPDPSKEIPAIEMPTFLPFEPPPTPIQSSATSGGSPQPGILSSLGILFNPILAHVSPRQWRASMASSRWSGPDLQGLLKGGLAPADLGSLRDLGDFIGEGENSPNFEPSLKAFLETLSPDRQAAVLLGIPTLQPEEKALQDIFFRIGVEIFRQAITGLYLGGTYDQGYLNLLTSVLSQVIPGIEAPEALPQTSWVDDFTAPVKRKADPVGGPGNAQELDFFPGFGSASPSDAPSRSERPPVELGLDLGPEGSQKGLSPELPLPGAGQASPLSKPDLMTAMLKAALTQLQQPKPEAPLPPLLEPVPPKQDSSGEDAWMPEEDLRWEKLSLDEKCMIALEGDQLFDLGPEKVLALLKDLLSAGRLEPFIQVLERYGEYLADPSSMRRKVVTKAFGDIAGWLEVPGMPTLAETCLEKILRNHLDRENDPEIYSLGIQAFQKVLSHHLVKHEIKQVYYQLLELLDINVLGISAEMPSWKRQCLEDLLTALTEPATLNPLLEELYFGDKDTIAVEVHPLISVLGRRAGEFLVKKLGEERDRSRRGRIIEALKAVGDAAVLPLKESLNSNAWYLVRNALNILGDLGVMDAFEEITTCLNHSDARVQWAAIRALWKIDGSRAEPILVAQLGKGGIDTQIELLYCLSDLKSESAIPVIAQCMRSKWSSDSHEKLREKAVEALAATESPKAVPVLGELLKKRGFLLGYEPFPIRKAACQALLRLGSAEAKALVDKAIQNESNRERKEALKRLLEEKPETT